MKIISFLLFSIISAQLQLLNKLKQTSFGQSVEQTLLLQLQYDETKQKQMQKYRVKNILSEIEESLIQEQKEDDLNFKKEYDVCNKNEITAEINSIIYEQSSIEQRIKQLNSQFDQMVLKSKRKELDFIEKQLNETVIQLQVETNTITSSLTECDELLQLLQFVRYQYDKKILSNQVPQQRELYLSELHFAIKKHVQQIQKLISKQSNNYLIQIVLRSFASEPENYEKLSEIIEDILEILEKDKDKLREQSKIIIDDLKKSEKYFIENIQVLQQEISSFNQKQSIIQQEVASLEDQVQHLNQSLIIKQQLQKDKDTMCNELANDYEEYRTFRDSQRQQVSDLIGIIERDIFAVKDYYILNGQLRQ